MLLLIILLKILNLKDELKTVFKALDIKVSDNEIKMVLKKMDSNGDGEISFEGYRNLNYDTVLYQLYL
jgi:Ca2+-binding EF-hand superfamily protein